jgi:hypothetical protein
MLTSRNIRAFSRFRQLRRNFTVVKSLDSPPLDLQAHIDKYKSRTFSDNFMNLDTLPELGNHFNLMTDRNEVSSTPYQDAEHYRELIGHEQVSPHYENFMMSRKVALTIFGIFGFSAFFSVPGSLSYALDYAMVPSLYFITLMYFTLEGRKSTLLPLLNRFYSYSAFNEVRTLYANFQENMNPRFRERESYAREQLEYFDLHKEFVAIKNEAVSRLLVAEESYLKNHVKQRALNLLEGAKAMEVQNQKKVSSEVLNNIKKEMRNIKENPSADIKQDSFARALDGIRNGKLDYGQDLILSKVLQVTRSEIEKVNNLSEAQKDEMLCLTQAQINSLKAADEMAQKEYLNKRPVGLEGSFKEHEGYARTMAQW